MNTEDVIKDTIEKRLQYAEKSDRGHYEARLFYERLFLSLGIPVIVLSAFIGGSEVLEIIPERLGGVISLCVAVLAGLQTFLKFSQRSERHRTAGARYGAIKRALEEVRITLSESLEKAKVELHEITERADALSSECPEIPRRIYRRYESKSFDL